MEIHRRFWDELLSTYRVHGPIGGDWQLSGVREPLYSAILKGAFARRIRIVQASLRMQRCKLGTSCRRRRREISRILAFINSFPRVARHPCWETPIVANKTSRNDSIWWSNTSKPRVGTGAALKSVGVLTDLQGGFRPPPPQAFRVLPRKHRSWVKSAREPRNEFL